ncbi:pectate lyase, partial [Staphylococcus warneri]
WNVISNEFIMKMKDNAIHNRNYNNVKHTIIFIAGTTYNDNSQKIHLENIDDLTLNQDDHLVSIEKKNVENIK